MLVSGDIAAEQLIREACDRIDLIEPRLCALVAEPNRERRLLAEAERQDPSLRPFLVSVKDIINVAGLPTRAGSTLPAELFVGPEATVVSRLREAGAIVLGKTTTTEFAFSEPAPTTNPHNERHTPGGSSSGSAASVAAGYVPLAIGTQTVDSIVTPASYCGVVGYKPSYSRIPIDNVLPFSQAMDHVGFLASDLKTIEFAAGIVCSEWRGAIEPELPAIGLPTPLYIEPVEPAALAAFDRTVAALSAVGCRVVQADSLADISEIGRRHRRLIAAQFATVHREWFSDYGDRYRPKSAALFAEGAALGPDAVEEGLKGSTHLRTDLEQTMDELGIDIWMSPATTGPAPRGLETIGDPIMALPWTHAHLPVVCLPTGTAPSGLPLSTQLVGRLGADEELLMLRPGSCAIVGVNAKRMTGHQALCSFHKVGRWSVLSPQPELRLHQEARPCKFVRTSYASRVTSTGPRAREMGQLLLAFSACSWKAFSSIPATFPLVTRWIRVTVHPVSNLSM